MAASAAAPAGGQYGAFVTLPVPGYRPGSSPAPAGGPAAPDAAAAASSAAAVAAAEERAKAGFALATAVLADYDRWAEAKTREESARRERKMLMQVPDTAAGTAAQAGGVRLHIKLPDGRCMTHGFQMSNTCFDINSKVYTLLRDQATAYQVQVTGPRGGPLKLDSKKMRDDCLDGLLDFGFQAGKDYDVEVTQGRR